MLPETPTAARNLLTSPLRGLLEVTRLLRAQGKLPELLDAIARTIGESLGYATVAINLYRPGMGRLPRQHRPRLRGRQLDPARPRPPVGDWDVLLSDEFLRRDAYLVPAGAVDWDALPGSYVPPGERSSAPDAWDPEDALFAPMREQGGMLLGIISVDEPVSGRRPSDVELDVLVALADHAALAVEATRKAAASEHHRRALEQLLDVSSRLAAEPTADEILLHVCTGIREALGFRNVCAALIEAASGRILPRAAVGWDLADPALHTILTLATVEPLLDPCFRREGCYLLPDDEVRRVLGMHEIPYASRLNGRGPLAWNRHRLIVPLRGRDGVLLGLIWVGDPEDRLLPSTDRLQALRIFADDAAAALVSGRHLDELRFLADHDPLTRLLNRRAFVKRLEGEVARTSRYGRPFGLVLIDLDGFKQLNDHFGHPAGDDALQLVGSVLSRALRRSDDAFRLGGDEFALILAEASREDARMVVSRTQRLLAGIPDERFRGVGASFGCACCPEDSLEPHGLFRRADEALYEAKRTGVGFSFAA